MIEISEELRSKIQTGKVITHARIVIDDHVFGYDNKDNTAVPYDDGSIHKLHLKYDIDQDEFAIGTACLQICEVMLYGAADFEFERKYATIYIGYELDRKFTANGKSYPRIEWLPMGVFFTTEVIKKNSWVSFIGYDRLYKCTDMIYVPSKSLGKNPTVYDAFMDIFKFIGASFDEASFRNMMYSRVDMNLLYGADSDGNTTGYSVRDAMAYLAGKVGGCIIVNRYDKFKLLEYSFPIVQKDVGDNLFIEDEYLITDNDISDFQTNGDGVHGMSYIDVANSGEVIRYENKYTPYKNGFVLDSPIITDTMEAAAVLDRINNVFINKGNIFYMTPCFFNLLNGDISLELGDIITYASKSPYTDGKQSYIPIMHMHITYTGRPDIEIAAYSQTQTQQENRTGPMYRMFSAFKRAANNKYKYLDEAISIVSNQITSANGGYIVVDKNEDGSWRQIRVLDNADNPKTAIVINKNGVGFSQDGGKTINSAAITIDGKIVANSMTGGVLQAAQGYIGDWIIDNGDITYKGGLFADYVGPQRAYRTFLQPAYDDESNIAENTWVFSIQTASVTDGKVGGYSSTWRVEACGDTVQSGKAYHHGDVYITNGKSLETNRVNDLNGNNLIGVISGNTVIGLGDQNRNTNIYTSPNYSVNFCFGTVGTRISFTHSNDCYWIQTSKTLVLNSSVVHCPGDLKINWTANSGLAPLYVNASGVVVCSTSSERYKENITDDLEDWLNPERLYDLPVVQYNYKDAFRKNELVAGTQIGITAEDVEKYYPNALIRNAEGQAESWQDRIMIPAMLKLIQAQKKQLDEQRNQINDLNARLEKLEKQIK